VGDTLTIRPVEVTAPGGCSPGSVTYTHNVGTDFYINIPYYIYQRGPTPTIGDLMFAPQKIGLQCDTFYVTEKGAWNRTYPCGPDTHDTFMICAEGISGSQNLVYNNEDANSISVIAINHEIILKTEFNQSQHIEFSAFDALGRPQPLPISELQIPAGTNSQKIEVGNIPIGWYMLRMKTNDQVISKSFIMLR
jgi:hypothetical protein